MQLPRHLFSTESRHVLYVTLVVRSAINPNPNGIVLLYSMEEKGLDGSARWASQAGLVVDLLAALLYDPIQSRAHLSVLGGFAN